MLKCFPRPLNFGANTRLSYTPGLNRKTGIANTMTTHVPSGSQSPFLLPREFVGDKLSHHTILGFLTTGSRSFWLCSFLALLGLPLAGVAAEDKVAKQLDQLLNGSCQPAAPGFSV